MRSFPSPRSLDSGRAVRGRATVAVLALLASLCLLALCACGAEDGSALEPELVDRPPSATGQARAARGLPSTSSWAYMIQGDATKEVVRVDLDVLVMDYTKDGSDDRAQRYSSAELGALKENGSRMCALAYLSIGEAEDYRYYFDQRWTDEAGNGAPDPDAPDWLRRVNPDWEGNHKVQYWSDEWQHIVLGYIDRLVAYGFDGAYLDVVDGFEYWSGGEYGEDCTLAEAEAAERMIAFVERIATRARARRADFVIVPQNGERILDYDTDGSYLEAIDGIGVEDLFFDGRSAIDASVINERTRYLNKVLAAGKPVMVVDYVFSGHVDTLVDEFITRAEVAGYSPYAAHVDRALDEIVTVGEPGG